MRLLLSALVLSLPAPAFAFTLNYGDCDDLAHGGTVVYQQVTESTSEPGPLYNAPSCVRNVIDFDPTGFEARDDLAGNASPDQMEGMLDFAISAVGGSALTSIAVSEGGDRQVFGFDVVAYVRATLTVDLTLFISDGGGGETGIPYQDILSVIFQLPGDFSASQRPWSLDASFEMSSILSDACLGQGQYSGSPTTAACGAETARVSVHVDNLLEGFAEDGALAAINKKDIESLSITTATVPVPEPSTAALTAVGLLSFAAARRWRAFPRG